MVLERDYFDSQKFLEIFEKKFLNFLEKSPLYVRYTLANDKVLVYDFSRNPEEKPLQFELDYSLPVKENIKRIKDILVKERYPTFDTFFIKSRPLNSSEIQREMDKGVPFSELSSKKVTLKTKVSYRVEKVINQDNRIILRKISGEESEDTLLYKLKIPVTYFLQDVYSNPEKASDTFLHKSQFIKKLFNTNKESL